jgi:hypothetical protein
VGRAFFGVGHELEDEGELLLEEGDVGGAGRIVGGNCGGDAGERVGRLAAEGRLFLQSPEMRPESGRNSGLRVDIHDTLITINLIILFLSSY